MICASEQTCTVIADIYDKVKKEFEYRGAYFLNKEEKEKVGKVIIINGSMNAKIVGQPAWKIAEMCGIEIPHSKKVLIAEVTDNSKAEPFAHEARSGTRYV